MNHLIHERLHSNLLYLKLNTIEQVLDNYLELAAKDDRTIMEVLDHLIGQESKQREAAAIEKDKVCCVPDKKNAG